MRTISDRAPARALLTGFWLLAANISGAASGSSPVTISSIHCETRGNGTTVVTVRADETLAQHAWRRTRIPGLPPREVLQLKGIAAPYRETEILVGDINLVRIRTGHHIELDPPELHLVFDLTDPRVEVTGLLQVDETIIVELARPPAAKGPQDTSDEPLAAGLPQQQPTESPTESSALIDGSAGRPQHSPAPLLTRIETTKQGGVTVVELTAEAPFPPRSVGELYLAGNPPRQVVSLLGYRLSQAVAERMLVGDGTLNEIRLTPYPNRRPPEIHITLELAGPTIEVLDLTHHNGTLTVKLAAP